MSNEQQNKAVDWIRSVFSSSYRMEQGLQHLIESRGAKRPVFYHDPELALKLAHQGVQEFVLTVIPEGKNENIMIIAAAYDCMLLNDEPKAGEFLSVLERSLDKDAKKKTFVANLTLAYFDKNNWLTDEDRDRFIVLLNKNMISGVTPKTIAEALQRLK